MPTAVRCGQPTKTPRRAWAPGLGAEPLLRATQVPSLLFFTSVIPGPIEGPIRSGSLASVWRGVQGTGNSPLEMQWSGGQQRCPFRSEQPQPEEGGRPTALQPTMAIARDTGWRAKKTRTKEDEEVDRSEDLGQQKLGEWTSESPAEQQPGNKPPWPSTKAPVRA